MPAAPRAEAPIEDLVARHRLPSEAALKLAALLGLLVGDPSAPIGVRDPEAVIEGHLADSLAALELDEVRGASQVVDVGTGAGLPGLPLAIAMPTASFSLVESSARKCAFVQRAVVESAIANAQIVRTRVESWHEGLNRFDLVIARALGPLAVVVEYAAPLLRIGGAVVVWQGQRDPGSESAAALAGEELGLEPVRITPVRPYPASRNRHLHLMLKVRDTPAEFPRRPGVALKRPLKRELGARSDRSRR